MGGRSIKGLAVVQKTRKRTTVIVNRFADSRHLLRRGGAAHACFCNLDVVERRSVLKRIGIRHINRVGHKKHVPQLRMIRDLEANFEAIDQFLLSKELNDGITIIGDVFADTLNQVWDRAVEILGSASEFPTVNDLVLMRRTLNEEFSLPFIDMFLAASVEVKVNCRNELLKLNDLESAGRKFMFVGTGDESPPSGPHLVEIDPQVKASRRSRRVNNKEIRAEKLLQREAAERDHREFKDQLKAKRNAARVEAAPIHISEKVPTFEIDRLIHSHLPSEATNRTEFPVGHIARAFIKWGQDFEFGKVRPVLVVASNSKYVWVRPIYTNDYTAGRWKAVEIFDWKQAGLDHSSYVASYDLRLSKHRCDVSNDRMTLNDWNRVCRGEVHGD